MSAARRKLIQLETDQKENARRMAAMERKYDDMREKYPRYRIPPSSGKKCIFTGKNSKNSRRNNYADVASLEKGVDHAISVVQRRQEELRNYSVEVNFAVDFLLLDRVTLSALFTPE